LGSGASGKGLAPATVHKAYQLLTLIMDAAVDAPLIRSSPCYNIPLPRIEREETRLLAPGQVWKLADAVAPRYRALIFVGCYGGLRIGEMAGLERRHLGSDAARLRVDMKLSRCLAEPNSIHGRRRASSKWTPRIRVIETRYFRGNLFRGEPGRLVASNRSVPS
jgi:hypothetical protein